MGVATENRSDPSGLREAGGCSEVSPHSAAPPEILSPWGRPQAFWLFLSGSQGRDQALSSWLGAIPVLPGHNRTAGRAGRLGQPKAGHSRGSDLGLLYLWAFVLR